MKILEKLPTLHKMKGWGSGSAPLFRATSNFIGGLFWPKTNHYTRYCEHLRSGFRITLFKNKQTNCVSFPQDPNQEGCSRWLGNEQNPASVAEQGRIKNGLYWSDLTYGRGLLFMGPGLVCVSRIRAFGHPGSRGGAVPGKHQ